ncbi:MAG TPA: Uma2 family endonuclease [Isosphaeraceae bacterium]|jgi:Uma2 family endonuclease|nr:Uma2 family endonuclease [Isosphaeraceae bacterium]
MSVATIPLNPTEPPEQRLVLRSVGWETYVATSNALGERRGLRLIYVDGRLIFLTKSRRHEWYSDRLAELFKAVATGCGVAWESAGETTFRREDSDAGIEGDETFYVGENADRMRGPQNVDLNVDPAPDLAIEVEVTHPADDAMTTYGRLGVREVWRFDAGTTSLGFWLRRDDGAYESAARSAILPVLEPADVVEQLRLAGELGASRWFAQLDAWVRDVLMPRQGKAT